jgi:hypothetical protein
MENRREVTGTVQDFVRDEKGRVVAVYIDGPLGLVNVTEPFMSFAGKRVRLTVEVVGAGSASAVALNDLVIQLTQQNGVLLASVNAALAHIALQEFFQASRVLQKASEVGHG